LRRSLARLFWRERGDDFFEARIAAQRVPEGHKLECAHVGEHDAPRVYVLQAGRSRRQSDLDFLRSVLRSGTILMQNRAILRNALRKRNYELPSVSNDMQSSEVLRNSLGLNYKSAALSQLSDQRISAINRLRLDTSSLQKME
jgi:hypothetical protein